MQVIIFGNQQNAEMAKFYLEQENYATIAAFCLDDNYIKESTFCGKPLISLTEVRKNFDNSFKFFAPLADNELREEKYLEIKNYGYDFISFVSPKCTNYGFVGDNCFILENNNIQYKCRIGNNNILWSGNHIGHHTIIEDSCFISSHVVICGNCIIRKYSWIGVNTSIKEWTKIGERTFIGMGSIVINNTDGGKYYGSPAKRMD